MLVKADKLTKKQQDELVSQFNFTQASQAKDKVKQGIKEDFGISSQLDVFYIKRIRRMVLSKNIKIVMNY